MNHGVFLVWGLKESVRVSFLLHGDIVSLGGMITQILTISAMNVPYQCIPQCFMVKQMVMMAPCNACWYCDGGIRLDHGDGVNTEVFGHIVLHVSCCVMVVWPVFEMKFQG